MDYKIRMAAEKDAKDVHDIYFFAGENDMTCNTSLQKEYYEMIKAPHKEFFLYEGCAHSPIYEDGDKTCEILESIKEPSRD